MKQKTLIIVGILILILLLAVWLYLLFFNEKADDGTFTDLGPEGGLDGGVVLPPPPDVEPGPATTTRPRLRQLTTRPVIGFVEVGSPTSTLLVNFAEAGTGHVYAVDVYTGAENRISNTTVAEANFASFAPNGNTVAIRAKNDRRTSPITLGVIDSSTGGLLASMIDKDIYDFAILNDTELVYTLRTGEGLENRFYNLTTNVDSALFTVPFYEATMQWGASSTDTHYVYPKPVHLLEGYLYKFQNNTMVREPIQGFGLTAINTPDYTPYTSVSSLITSSYVYKKASSTRQISPVIFIPEKCVQGTNTSELWCGYEVTELPTDFPDAWYRGNISFTDNIWKINLEDGSAESIVNTLLESGREIDITSMSIGQSGTGLYFINKNDNTLWVYEL